MTLTMRKLILILIFVTVCECFLQNVLDLTFDKKQSFEKWKKKFNKHYASKAEEDEAMENFLINKRSIDEHNRQYELGEVSFTRSLWEYSDESDNQKEGHLLGAVMSTLFRGDFDDPPSSFPKGPESIDWVRRGLVGPVEAQGMCGSCWAFTAKGVAEAVLRRRNIRTAVSAQQMLDCSHWSCYGCVGGWPAAALDYMKDNGFTSDFLYPYFGRELACKYSRLMAIGFLSQTFLIWTNGNETLLRDIVAAVGPISIMMKIEPSLYSYSSGIYYEPNCGKDTNHAMLLVGYGTDRDEGDYWLIKNSWGRSWGEGGYIRFARNRGNLCNIAHSAIYAT